MTELDPGGAVEASALCYHCQSPLPHGTAICPECGRKQFRACFCGATIAAGLASCPACGADWAGKVKVRRRSRTVQLKPAKLLRSALVGALAITVLTAVINLVITALAERSAAGGVIPASFTVRLYYAWLTLSHATATLFSRLLGSSGLSLLIALGGALVGVLIYLVHIGYLRLPNDEDHGRHGTLRRRRRR